MDRLPPPSTAPAGWYPDPVSGEPRYFDGRSWHGGGFHVVETPGHPDLPLPAALGALAVLVVSLVSGKAVVDALVGRDWPLITYILISVVISYGPSVAWLFHVRRRWGAGRFESIGWRFRWIDLAWGPVTWLAAIGVQLVLAAIVLIFDIPLSSNVESISGADADRAYLIATAVAAVVAAPVVEELVFRGLVMRGLLSRFRPVVAVALQGVLFGVAHVDPVRGVGNVGLAVVLSGVGVALGASAYLTRRLGPSVVAHAIFNGVVVAILLSGVLDDIGDSPFESSVAHPVVECDADASCSAVELEVVDQSDVAEPRCDEQDGTTLDALERIEGGRVRELRVLERGAWLGVDHVDRDLAEAPGVPHPGSERGVDRSQRS